MDNSIIKNIDNRIIILLCTILLLNMITFTAISLSKAGVLSASAVQSQGIFNISNEPPQITAPIEIIADAGDLITVSHSVFDPNGDATTVNFTLPVNSTAQWQSTAGDAGVTTVDITASDGSLVAVHTVTIKLHPYCGDGTVDAGEGCDDGNNANGDGCSATCTSEAAAPGGGGGGGGTHTPPTEEPEVPRPELPPLLPPRPPTRPTVPEPEEEKELTFVPVEGIVEGDTPLITVLDDSGNPVINARVEATSPSGQKYVFETDSNGNIRLTVHEDGNWVFTALKSGYTSSYMNTPVRAKPIIEAPAVVCVQKGCAWIQTILATILLMVLAFLLVAFLHNHLWYRTAVLNKKGFRDITVTITNRSSWRTAHRIKMLIKTDNPHQLTEPVIKNYTNVSVQTLLGNKRLMYSLYTSDKPMDLHPGEKVVLKVRSNPEHPSFKAGARYHGLLPIDKHARREKEDVHVQSEQKHRKFRWPKLWENKKNKHMEDF